MGLPLCQPFDLELAKAHWISSGAPKDGDSPNMVAVLFTAEAIEAARPPAASAC